jgi:hypothetical protein
MADIKSCVQGESFKLRAGTPQPVCATNTTDCLCNEDQSGPTTQFILQTFGAEKRVVNSIKATTRILASEDFIGLNPQADYESASYQGTNYTDADGEVMFTGQEQSIPEYTTEDQMVGVTNFQF